MSGGVVLLVNLVAAAALLVLAAAAPTLHRSSRGRLERAAVPLGVLPLVVVVGLLTAYVFGEDSYRGNGISRWEAYRSPGGALGPMFLISVALLCGCAALIAYAGRRGRRRLLRGAAVVGGLASLLLVTATVIGFTAN